ncbi:hypothetical protein LEP1GSC186_4771 [Leptospira noguchii serovar Autumnalis str. ZUN142]|uniref:Uncharacterized protein n=1 Tax=Leptospira noguchii serovar Autumnalis str. ZUN142 TaxID=1085540 RepID=M6UH64_9LEPT|nr:hypothetical protein LEP1GSC186_4771 [Leptospira noguchii serovar Autumnalis str. ZUN142]
MESGKDFIFIRILNLLIKLKAWSCNAGFAFIFLHRIHIIELVTLLSNSEFKRED